VELDSPHLFSSGADGASVAVTSDFGQEWMELAVHGRWDLKLAGDVRTGIYKCIVEHPTGVLVDLRDLGDPDGASVPMWLAAYRAGCIPQPPVRLALCVPPATTLYARLRKVGAPQFLPVFESMPEAREALRTSLSLPDHLSFRLPPIRGSLSQARDLVGEACTAWHLTRLLYPVRIVMSELVTNALEHAGTTIRVMVARRGTGLYLAVHDDDRRLPCLLQPPASNAPGAALLEHGQGLHLVHATANAWGARATSGGKVVWATINSHGR